MPGLKPCREIECERAEASGFYRILCITLFADFVRKRWHTAPAPAPSLHWRNALHEHFEFARRAQFAGQPFELCLYRHRLGIVTSGAFINKGRDRKSGALELCRMRFYAGP